MIQHANKGRGLETAIIASQGRYVTLDQHGQQAKRLPGGRMVAKRGPCDYSGTVNGVGRSIVFDAKVCQLATRFPIGNRDHFPEHQRQCLIRHGEAGAIAGLLVEATALGMYLWLDWRVIRDVKDPSIPWSDQRWQMVGVTTMAIQWGRIPGLFKGVSVLDERAAGEEA